MSQIIDRRTASKKKSAVSRQRFLRRYKNQIKQAVSDAIAKRSITDMQHGENVSIPAKDIAEPAFSKAKGGVMEGILPGNDEFLTGDKIQRPSSGQQGQGDQASAEGEGQDDFVFELSREEFLDLYFEDLALPDLVKKELGNIDTYKSIRAGFSNTGIPTNINVNRSMRHATGRRMALRAPYKRQLLELEALLHDKHIQEDTAQRRDIEEKIVLLKRKIHSVPFIDNIDLRYNNRYRVKAPFTQAVMFCVMDVSGSMDEVKKDIAKRFFILLYLFLIKNYQKIDLVFIRHHTAAKEVSEQDFFYSRETGGTVVSSALELLYETIMARYPVSAWNIYVAQASDGDNWNADSPRCYTLLHEKIMPLVQYFAYVEIMPRQHQSLWEAYEQVKLKHPHFAMETIQDMADIYGVFRTLFQRKVA
jgi:uncharacterized sporulation protein YeaH/YhbH (DUF444 family)